MKKIILGMALVALAVNAHAQGTIVFANSSSSLITTNTGGSIQTTASGGSFKVALYWGVLGATEDQLVQIGTAGVQAGGSADAGISPIAGRFNVSTPYVTGSNTAPGSTATFQVRAWSGGYDTYELALAAGSAYTGKFTLFSNTTGGAGSPPGSPAVFSGFQAFTVSVPEPTTIALGLLGASSLLLVRRKK